MWPYHIGEEEPRVGQLEVLEQRVELDAVERAPRAVEVFPRLRLLSRVGVVQELIHYPQRLVRLAQQAPPDRKSVV